MKIYKLILVAVLFLGTLNAADISGQAFVKTEDGRIITCAGEKVYIGKEGVLDKVVNLNMGLITTEAQYSFEKAMVEFQRVSGQPIDKKKLNKQNSELLKINNELSNIFIPLNIDPSDLNVTTTICDAQGNFEFRNLEVSNGNEYYIIISVIKWKENGESKKRILSGFESVKTKDEKLKVIITK